MSEELQSALEASKSAIQGDQPPAEDDVETPLQPAENSAEGDPPPAKDWSDQDETLARSFGWVPKDEWRGPEEQWTGADLFANKIRGRVSTVDKLERRLAEKDRELQAAQARQAQEIEGVRNMLQAGMERRIEALQAAQERAVEDSDVARYKELNAEINAVREQQAQAQAPQQPAQPDAGLAPEVRDFKVRNSNWFGDQTNPDHLAATTWAVARAQQLADQNYSNSEQLEAVEREIGERFGLGPQAKPKTTPQPQPQPQQRAPAPAHQTVDSGSAQHATRLVNGSRKKTFTDLPDHAKAEFQIGVKRGWWKNDKDGRQYAADAYFKDE